MIRVATSNGFGTILHRIDPRQMLVVACALVILGSACSTIRPVLPSDFDDIELKDGQGLLLLDLDADLGIDELHVDLRRLDISELRGQYEIYILREGLYNWRGAKDQINDRFFRTWNFRDIGDRRRRRFRVIAGKLNYPGQLRLKQLHGNYIKIALVNRSAIAFADVQEKFPMLVERYPMTYTGFQRDDFLEMYQAELQLRRNRLQTVQEAE